MCINIKHQNKTHFLLYIAIYTIRLKLDSCLNRKYMRLKKDNEIIMVPNVPNYCLIKYKVHIIILNQTTQHGHFDLTVFARTHLQYCSIKIYFDHISSELFDICKSTK